MDERFSTVSVPVFGIITEGLDFAPGLNPGLFKNEILSFERKWQLLMKKNQLSFSRLDPLYFIGIR